MPTWRFGWHGSSWGDTTVKSAIIAVGDEIVSGLKADINSSYLAARLGEMGISVSRIVAVGDRCDEIVRELREAARDCDLVIVAGGLGPTADDVTRQALAETLGTRLVLDGPALRRLEERFVRRGAKLPENMRVQAMLPEGARALPNPAGAAPVLAFMLGSSRVYAFPGVPGELRAIFGGDVSDELMKLPGRDFIKTITLRTIGLTESQISDALVEALPALEAKLAFLPEEVGVRLTLAAASTSEADALAALERARGMITAALGDRVYSASGEDLQTVVAALLKRTRRTLAVAESCTGGLICHMLTEVPGISAYFERGIVAYSNSAKLEAVGVDPGVLAERGAVSEEVAGAMARGIRARAKSDLGLATTGIAGPSGGTAAKPVGLVYMALAHESGCEVVRHVFLGGRRAVKMGAAARALDMVRCHLARI
jgi:nicotinamide-nucleotide amidase